MKDISLSEIRFGKAILVQLDFPSSPNLHLVIIQFLSNQWEGTHPSAKDAQEDEQDWTLSHAKYGFDDEIG